MCIIGTKEMYRDDLQRRNDCIIKVVKICESDLANKKSLKLAQMVIFATAKHILGDTSIARELILIAKADYDRLGDEDQDNHLGSRITRLMNKFGIQ